MKNERRIDEFCDRLKEEWKKLPDWRFGQLICSSFSAVAMDEHVSIYHISDDHLLELIQEYVDGKLQICLEG